MKASALVLASAMLLAACSQGAQTTAPPGEPTAETQTEEPDGAGDGTIQPESPAAGLGDEQADALDDMIQRQNRVVGLLSAYVREGLNQCVGVADPAAFAACFDDAAEQFKKARRAFNNWRPTVEPSLREAGVDYTPRIVRAWLHSIEDLNAHEADVLAQLRACLGTSPTSADVDRCLAQIAPVVLEGVELLEALGEAENAVRQDIPIIFRP